MNTVEKQKFVLMLPPVSATGGAHSGNTYVDTEGWGHLRVLIITGSLGANAGSTDSSTAPKLEECDTSGGSYSDVASAALASVLTGTTENNMLFAIDVNLNKSHKRYMRVNAPTAGAGACLLSIVGILSDRIAGPPFGGGATAAGLQEKISA